MDLKTGTIIHVNQSINGLDHLTNLPDLPCRAAIVTGPPSERGVVPVNILVPWGPTYGGVVDPSGHRWHLMEDCPYA